MVYSRTEIHEQLCCMMEELFEIDASRIVGEADLVHDLDIDSIDMVDLLIALKNKTGKKIAPEVFQRVRNVAELLDAVESVLAS